LLLFFHNYLLIDKGLLYLFESFDEMLVYFFQFLAFDGQLFYYLLKLKLLLFLNLKLTLKVNSINTIIARLSDWKLFAKYAVVD
jgi:hypothetical protein